ncbi:MAG: AI-2E family transporter [Deltaproteobacteria bacterium]|nr:AI-2E family transporter [Deltaproteobacteria bacterium]
MSSPPTTHTPIPAAAERQSNRFAFFALILAIALFVLMLFPLWRPLLLASVLAAFVGKTHNKIALVVRWRWLSSLLVTLGVTMAILLPIAALVAIAIDQGGDAWAELRMRLTPEHMKDTLESLPSFIRPLALQGFAAIQEATGGSQGVLKSNTSQIMKWMGGSLGLLTNLVTQAAVMIIALYFLLLDSRRLASWLVRAFPLPEVQTRTALGDFRRSARAALGGNLGTAAAQALVATIGYLIAGAPQAVFFGLLTFFTSFFPAVGSAMVALPLAAWLAFDGHTASAIFLALWAVLVVGLVDNLLRPMLTRGNDEAHSGLVFFAILGSLSLLGPIGLVAGPLTVSAFVTLHKVWNQQTFETTDVV